MAAYSTMMAAGEGARVRVRTPGKYIVMCVGAALIVIVGAASLLARTDVAAPFTGTEAVRAAGATNAIELPEFLVDLSPDSSGRISYIRLSVSVLVPAKAGARASARIAATTPEISERIAFMLRGLAPEDFAGEAGMARVKAELLRRVNLVIAPDQAQDVIVTDIVIQ